MTNRSSSLKIAWVLIGLMTVGSMSTAHAAKPMPPDTLVYSVTYRDFPYYGGANPVARTGNPFFENDIDTTGPKALSGTGTIGGHNFVVLKDTLVDGKPQFYGFTNGTQKWDGGSMDTLKRYFYEWFGQDNMGSVKSVTKGSLTVQRKKLVELTDGRTVYTYKYEWLSNPQGIPGYDFVKGYPAYFPIAPDAVRGTDNFKKFYGNREVKDGNGVDRNFAFTSEFTGTFTLPPGTQSFEVNARGDDDTWVFINGHAVTGWIHSGNNNINKNGVPTYVYLDSAKLPYEIEIGKPMTIKVFYAERHTGCASISVEFKAIMYAYMDNLNVSAKAVPTTSSAKVWFDESTSREVTLPIAP